MIAITISKIKRGKYNYFAIWQFDGWNYVEWFSSWKECREYFEKWDNVEINKTNF